MSAKSILLIEDNPNHVALTRRALEKARIANELIIAEDGQEALDYLFAAGRYTGRETSYQPMLTLLEDITASYDLGTNTYIRKPVDFTQFVHIVEQLGLYWLVMNEPPPLRADAAS